MKEVKTVKLYKPIRLKLREMNVKNFNFLVNSLLGEKIGIPQQVIDAYRRGDDEDETGT